MSDLQQKGQNIKICIEDYRIYTYWLREPELRNHMEQILRAAISAAKASNDKIKHDKLMKMGSMWKSHPNLASWHDADEPTDGIHNCFHSKIDEENYHKSGWRAVDFDTRAKMTVDLYYALKDAKGPEERNFYRQIYQQWHPESYEFRNANFYQYRFLQQGGVNIKTNVNTQDLEYREPKRIVIREEEYEEEDCFNGEEHYHAFNMEANIDDEDQVAYEDTQRHYSKEALRKAEAVKEVQAKCGKFSLRKLYDAFLTGAIVNTEGYTKTQIMTQMKFSD
jgi:hypothetical protein